MNRLKELLKLLNLTQTEFASELGLTQSTISGIISGKSQLTKITAFLIEKTYGISSEWLLYGTGEMRVSQTEEERQVQESQSILRRLDKNPEIREILEILLKADKKDLAQILAIAKTFDKKD